MDESQLHRDLSSVPKDSPEYINLLTDLASLKLGQGEVDEAQAILKQVMTLKSKDLEEAAKEVAQEEAPESSGDEDWESGWTSGLARLTAASEKPAAGRGRAPAMPGQARQGPRLRPAAPSSSGPPDMDPADAAMVRTCAHVVEIYGITGRAIEELQDFVEQYQGPPVVPNVRLLDPDTAIAVFPNEHGARALLDSGQRQYKVRPYSQASEVVLSLPPEELLAPRQRPKTNAAVARMLLSHALQRPDIRDKAGEQQLADARRSNKELRKQRQEAVDAVWGDD